MIQAHDSLRVETGSGGPKAWMPGFAEAIAYLADDPARPISAAWATSVLTSRLYNLHFMDLADRFHAVNPGATPSEAQRRFLSAEQASLITAQRDGNLPFPEYPSQAYANPKLWSHVYRWLRTTHYGYSSQYYTNVVRRELTTAQPQREVASRFIGRVLSRLIGEEPTWASCGCGGMLGDRLNWLSGHDEQFSFDTVEIDDGLAAGRLALSQYKADIFNSIVKQKDDAKGVVGIDRVDPAIPENKDWSRACSTPEELWYGEWDDLNRRLMDASVPSDRLRFVLADLARRSDMKDVVWKEGRFNAAKALFSWYPGSAETRRRKLKNMREVLVDDEHPIIIADNARTVSGDTHLMPDYLWKKPKVFVGYKGKLHTVLLASNGRFRRVQVLPALGELAKGGPYERQVRELLA